MTILKTIKASLMCLFMILSISQVMATPKSDICHIDDEGAIIPISVSDQAVQMHFANHGDFYPFTFFADVDGDGYGDAAITAIACEAPAGFVDNGNDCNDDDADINPGATEECNGVDDNCNGDVDEGDVCLVECACNTPGSFFDQLVTGSVILVPGVNGFCNNSDSTSLAVISAQGAIAAGGEAGASGSGNWACESQGGAGDVGFITGLTEQEGRDCGSLVRDALVASGVDPNTDCGPW